MKKIEDNNTLVSTLPDTDGCGGSKSQQCRWQIPVKPDSRQIDWQDRIHLVKGSHPGRSAWTGKAVALSSAVWTPRARAAAAAALCESSGHSVRSVSGVLVHSSSGCNLFIMSHPRLQMFASGSTSSVAAQAALSPGTVAAHTT